MLLYWENFYKPVFWTENFQISSILVWKTIDVLFDFNKKCFETGMDQTTAEGILKVKI